MRRIHLTAGVGILTCLQLAPRGIEGQRVTVVNMVPQTRSNETVNDAEPNIAVNPADVLQMAASAFTPNPAGFVNAPIYVSSDGGRTWNLNSIVPGNNARYGTGDISLAFGRSSGVLYAGILSGAVQYQLNILRATAFLTPTTMTTLVSRATDDQPFVSAASNLLGASRDLVYVGNNDISLWATTGRTATVDLSVNAATAAAPAGFAPVRLESRATGTVSQDAPSIRVAAHPDGTVYAAYFGWRSSTATTYTSDVVVVRDDNWAGSAAPFTALPDPSDRLNGIRVAMGVRIPRLTILLGRQRIGSSLAIVVDPSNSSLVYLAWADGFNASNYTIRVRKSTDRGATWSTDIDSATHATNPGLAINDDGTVALLYQQLKSSAGLANRWQTHLKLTNDEFKTTKDIILADFEDKTCVGDCGAGPLGDYLKIVALDRSFYGVFSGWNTPDRANFPSGVMYQRNVDFIGKTLFAGDNVTPVNESIDPFFFTIEPAEGRGFQYAPKMVCGTQTDATDGRLGRGVYTATINITNTGADPVRVVKKLALTYPPGDEQPGTVYQIASPSLPAGQAVATDCNEIVSRVFNGALPAQYIEGTLLVESSRDVDVTGVYTVSQDGAAGPTSLAVEQFAAHHLEEANAGPSTPVVIRTGAFAIATTYPNQSQIDLDGIQPFLTGDLLAVVSGNDVTITPQNGAKIYVGGLQPVEKAGCQRGPLSGAAITIDVNSIPVGMHLCVQTDLGRIAEATLTSKTSFSNLNFAFTLWQAVP